MLGDAGSGFGNVAVNPLHSHGSFCTNRFGAFVVDVLRLGGFGGGGNSTDEFVEAGLLALSKLSPLTRCSGFKFVELLDPRLGLRAPGPRIAWILSGSPWNVGDGRAGSFRAFRRVFRSYLSRMKRSSSISSEVSPPEKEVIGDGLLDGLNLWLEMVLPVERMV
jgi:hypothetical protein